MVNSRIKMQNDQLYVISTSMPQFHDESKGESTRLPGCPLISKWLLVSSEKKIPFLKFTRLQGAAVQC